MWGKIPLQKEPEDGDPDTEEGMVNALLLNGDGEDAVFETFADTQQCEPLTLVFDENGNGEALTDEEMAEECKNCQCPYCGETSEDEDTCPHHECQHDGHEDGGVDPRLVE